MDDDQRKAAGYRLQAARCLEVAEEMPPGPDRDVLVHMAQAWLGLARKAEAVEADS